MVAWGWWRGPRVTPTYELTEQAFRDLAAHTKRVGSELVVLLFPFKEQVYWHIARRYHHGAEGLDEDASMPPLRAVGSFLASQGIKYCDLTDDLRAEHVVASSSTCAPAPLDRRRQ